MGLIKPYEPLTERITIFSSIIVANGLSSSEMNQFTERSQFPQVFRELSVILENIKLEFKPDDTHILVPNLLILPIGAHLSSRIFRARSWSWRRWYTIVLMSIDIKHVWKSVGKLITKGKMIEVLRAFAISSQPVAPTIVSHQRICLLNFISVDFPVSE